jgi:oxygen-independent coproporphyrinogen III oxidase
MTRSLYIHIPFCRQKCPYCDFYSLTYSLADAEEYVKVLAGQINSLEGRFNTVYVGGGTPTVLAPELWRVLLKTLKRKLASKYEFTCEANPESAVPDKLKLLFDGGVNRLSLGLQSLLETKLKVLGRIHDAAAGLAALRAGQHAGFKNIGIDLIFGVSGESVSSWKKELKAAAGLEVTHISCYALTCEKGTPLFEAVKTSRVGLPGEAESASMYMAAMSFLPGRGFRQYEVSNFALPGKECRHNLNYWDNGQYLGLGPSAVSYFSGVRRKNVVSLPDYIKKVSVGSDPAVFKEELTPIRRAKETAALKIRTAAGIDFVWFNETTGFDFLQLEKKVIARLLSRGLVCYNISCRGIRLARKGFLFADDVSSEFL